MVEYISLRARTRRSRALHGSIFASRVSRDSLEGRVNSSLAPIMRLATSTSTPRARARSNARAERLARRSNARAGSRVVSRANADDASPSGLDDDAHVVLFGYGAQEVPRVRELVDALRAAVVDSGVTAARAHLARAQATLKELRSQLGAACRSAAMEELQAIFERVGAAVKAVKSCEKELLVAEKRTALSAAREKLARAEAALVEAEMAQSDDEFRSAMRELVDDA